MVLLQELDVESEEEGTLVHITDNQTPRLRGVEAEGGGAFRGEAKGGRERMSEVKI